MLDRITSFIPYLVLVSHIAFVFLLLVLVFRKSWGKEIADFLGKHAVSLGLVVALFAVAGSLFYSEFVGFEPCVLCWWQRVFLYPLVVIFAVALWKKLNTSFLYAVPLALLAGALALVHAYALSGGSSLLPCLAQGGECAKAYVLAFGYITIPVMALTIVLYIILLAWADKNYINENSNPQR